MKKKPLKNNAKRKNEQGQREVLQKGHHIMPTNKRMINKAPKEE
jgi:hypothetical protein